jgi:hypothetical protein
VRPRWFVRAYRVYVWLYSHACIGRDRLASPLPDLVQTDRRQQEMQCRTRGEETVLHWLRLLTRN